MATDKLRILILTDGIFPFVIGGMQKHAHYMAKYFLRKGVDLTLYHCVVDKEIPTDIDEKLRLSLDANEHSKLSSKCFRFPRLKIKIPGHYVLESYKYSKLLYEELIKEDRFDFIYVKGLSGWYTLKHKAGLPKIGIQLHGLEMYQPSSSFKNYLEKVLLRLPILKNLRRTDYVFSYGGKIKDLHLKLGCTKEQIIIQHGGIDDSLLVTESAITNKKNNRKFLFIGRNERRKGYSELKTALLKILDKYDFEFSFIGDIETENQIISNKIKYYGTISDAKTYYEIIDAHDVIVVPSISEGLPTVIIESMARGLIAIATDVGAVNGTVNSENGFLIEPGNVEQIKESIIKAIQLSEEELLTKKRKALQMIKENFNWEKLSDALLDFIQTVK